MNNVAFVNATIGFSEDLFLVIFVQLMAYRKLEKRFLRKNIVAVFLSEPAYVHAHLLNTKHLQYGSH